MSAGNVLLVDSAEMMGLIGKNVLPPVVIVVRLLVLHWCCNASHVVRSQRYQSWS